MTDGEKWFERVSLHKSHVPRGEAEYRDPTNPFNTWSGKGRPPTWIQNYLDQGYEKDDFLVIKQKERRAKPRYVDTDNPANTWQGRGRYPNWLKEKLAQGHHLKDFDTQGEKE